MTVPRCQSLVFNCYVLESIKPLTLISVVCETSWCISHVSSFSPCERAVMHPDIYSTLEMLQHVDFKVIDKLVDQSLAPP